VALIVKRHMGRLGYTAGDFAGHSLRRGHASTAARNGASERTIMRTTGHTSTQTVRGYIGDGEPFSDPSVEVPRAVTTLSLPGHYGRPSTSTIFSASRSCRRPHWRPANSSAAGSGARVLTVIVRPDRERLFVYGEHRTAMKRATLPFVEPGESA